MPGFRPSRAPWVIAALLLAAGVLALSHDPGEGPVSGHASVVDGDTIRLAGKRIRLVGLDAPELGQACRDLDGKDWPCGTAARAEMAKLVAGEITCAPQGRDRYGRVLARCISGTADVAQAIVRAGLAVADGDYFRDEVQAKADKAGVWNGSFLEPAEWRREHNGEQASTILDALRSWFR